MLFFLADLHELQWNHLMLHIFNILETLHVRKLSFKNHEKLFLPIIVHLEGDAELREPCNPANGKALVTLSSLPAAGLLFYNVTPGQSLKALQKLQDQPSATLHPNH